MGLKQCDKCSEMVDEAKAFCPGCGNAFVEEEKRQDVSEFESLDSTVKLGDTMYNQMLSDMGLNISKAPNVGEKRIEVLAPAAAAPAKPPENKPDKATPTSNIRWFILGGVILILGFLLILVAVILIYVFWPRSA